MNEKERFFGRTRRDIRRRASRVASQVRAVETHSDFDYRRAVTASLGERDQSQPFAALVDSIATILPRLAETSIRDYLLDGTYVDKDRLKKVLASMIENRELLISAEHSEGIDVNVYQLPIPPFKNDSDIPDRFLEEQDPQEPTDVR